MQVRYPLPLRLPHFSAVISQPPSGFRSIPHQPGDWVSFSGQSEPASEADHIARTIERKLRNPNPMVQRRGAEALVNLNDDDALIPLIRIAFQSKDTLAQSFAAEALKKIQSGTAMAKLIEETLAHPSQSVRLLAAEAIQYIPGEDSDALKRPLILKILGNPQLQASAIPATISLQDDDAKITIVRDAFQLADITTQKQILSKTPIQDWEKIASLIEELLDHPNVEIRKGALRAISKLEEAERMVLLYSKTLKDPDKWMRVQTLEMGLPFVEDPNGRATLIKQALEDSEPPVLKAAVWAIKYLPTDELKIPVLKQALEKRDLSLHPKTIDYVYGLSYHNLKLMADWIWNHPFIREEIGDEFADYP